MEVRVAGHSSHLVISTTGCCCAEFTVEWRLSTRPDIRAAPSQPKRARSLTAAGLGSPSSGDQPPPLGATRLLRWLRGVPRPARWLVRAQQGRHSGLGRGRCGGGDRRAGRAQRKPAAARTRNLPAARRAASPASAAINPQFAIPRPAVQAAESTGQTGELQRSHPSEQQQPPSAAPAAAIGAGLNFASTEN